MSDNPLTITGVDVLQRRLALMASQRDIDRAVEGAFQRGGKRIKDAAYGEASTKGVVRKLAGAGADRSAVRPADLYEVGAGKRSGNDLVVTLKVKGLAAIQERGDHIRPHVIRPRQAKRLAFVAAGKLVVTPIPVRHPGAQHPKMPAFEAAFAREQGAVVTEVETAVRAHLEAAARA